MAPVPPGPPRRRGPTCGPTLRARALPPARPRPTIGCGGNVTSRRESRRPAWGSAELGAAGAATGRRDLGGINAAKAEGRPQRRAKPQEDNYFCPAAGPQPCSNKHPELSNARFKGNNEVKYKETLFFSSTKILLCFCPFVFCCFFFSFFFFSSPSCLISGQVLSVSVLKRILMEVALSLSWLLLDLACAVTSVNKPKIKLEN